jgi:hypothetical protein
MRCIRTNDEHMVQIYRSFRQAGVIFSLSFAFLICAVVASARGVQSNNFGRDIGISGYLNEFRTIFSDMGVNRIKFIPIGCTGRDIEVQFSVLHFDNIGGRVLTEPSTRVLFRPKCSTRTRNVSRVSKGPWIGDDTRTRPAGKIDEKIRRGGVSAIFPSWQDAPINRVVRANSRQKGSASNENKRGLGSDQGSPVEIICFVQIPQLQSGDNEQQSCEYADCPGPSDHRYSSLFHGFKSLLLLALSCAAAYGGVACLIYGDRWRWWVLAPLLFTISAFLAHEIVIDLRSASPNCRSENVRVLLI